MSTLILFLSQTIILRLLTFFPWFPHGLALLDLPLYYNPSICSTVAFIVSLLLPWFPLTFCSTLNGLLLFIALLLIILLLIGMVFVIIEEMYHGRVSLIWMLLLLLSNLWVGLLMNWNISHPKYQVESHSTPWFSATFAAVIAHNNPLFCLYQHSKFFLSKVKFRQATNRRERVRKTTKLVMLIKPKSLSTSRNLIFATFFELLLVFEAKTNLPYLPSI